MLLVLLGAAQTTSGGSRSGGARPAATLALLVALIERRRGRQALVLLEGARMTSSPETLALPVVKLVVKLVVKSYRSKASSEAKEAVYLVGKLPP